MTDFIRQLDADWAFWIMLGTVLVLMAGYWLWDRRDVRVLRHRRREWKGRTTVATETPTPETPEAPKADLSKATVQDLLDAFRSVQEFNKPGKYVALLSSRRFQAAVVALIGIWSGYATKAVDLPTAIYSSVATVIGWMHSDATRKTE